MDMMELVRAWSGREVPVLASTLAALKILRRNEDRITGRDVSRVVLHDPLLTLRVLRYAQAKKTSRQPTEITTVEHAVMMHGITSFFREFSAVPALETILADDPVALQGALGVISRAHHAAAYARAIAAHRRDIESDEVTIGALLHDLAELLLWCHLPEAAVQISQLLEDARGLRSAAAQTVVLGFSNVDLQLALAQAWNLPELLRRLMDDNQAAQPRVVNVVTAVALARHSAHGWSDPALPDDFRRLDKIFGLSEEQSWRMVRNASLQAARNWTDHGVRPSAAWLPLEAGRPDTRARPSHPVAEDPDTLKRTLQQLASAPAGSDSAALAALALQGLQRGLGLQHVVYADVDPSGKRLHVRFSFGEATDDAAGAFGFELGAKHLFGRLMGKMQGVWAGGSNRAQLAALLSEAQRSRIGEGDFLAMSIFAGSEPKALVVAHRDSAATPIPETLYPPFKAVCLALAKRLGARRPA
jgi:HD-like signal output (HDOD) protein